MQAIILEMSKLVLYSYIVDILQDANDAQARAITSDFVPMMIVAGPGTGKTKTLTARIVHLLLSGVSPNAVLALTFTNKAAHEMRERVKSHAAVSVMPTIATFHALCLDIQRREQKAAIQFATDAERAQAVKEALRRTSRTGVSQRDAALLTSRAKGSLRGAQEDEGLVTAYNAALHEAGVMDFDDLILNTYHLLKNNSEVRDRYRARYQHILIDEFQDTSELQWALVQLLRGSESVFVIGDPKQSIYGFRGATRDMFAVFRADFPACEVVNLETNYRSYPEVVAIANAIFPNETTLTPHHTTHGLVRVMRTLNEYTEADAALKIIEEGVGGTTMLSAGTGLGGRRFRDFAIIYRTHRSAHVIEQRLHDSGIPYQVVGEDSPYEQPETRAIIDTLRWLEGAKTVPHIKGLTQTAVKSLLSDVESSGSVSGVAESIAERLRLGAGDKRSELRVKHFIGTLVRFASLNSAVAYFDAMAKQDFYDPQADAVTLLTIHASKGLEFTHVIMLATEEGILPHIRTSEAPNIAEERRLFYVAATRARHDLTMLYAKKRRGALAELSRYVQDISDKLLPRVDDPNMMLAQKRIDKRQQKARQGTLF